MTENRQFPRYRVDELESLHAKIDKNSEGERLIMIGLGGCGFYGFQESPFLRPVRRVNSIIQMDGVLTEPVEIQGRLLYAQDLEIEGKKVIFYGIEFIPPHRPLIEPIIHKLDELLKEGQIKTA